jgi:hypothetical protein
MKIGAQNTARLWGLYRSDAAHIYYLKAGLGAAWAGQVMPNAKPALAQMFSVATEANLGEEPPTGSESLPF